MKDKYTCPECKGSKGELIAPLGKLSRGRIWKECYFCEGTGFASEEDELEEFWK